MTSLLSRAFAALRVWTGLNDVEENRLHPAHGWLLPLPKPRVAVISTHEARATAARDGERG